MSDLLQIIFAISSFIIGCIITSKFLKLSKSRHKPNIDGFAVFVKGGPLLGVGTSSRKAIELAQSNANMVIDRDTIVKYKLSREYREGTILLIPCSKSLRIAFESEKEVFYSENNDGYLEKKGENDTHFRYLRRV